jgi:hypothetical protein
MQIRNGFFCAWPGSRAKTGEESRYSKSETATNWSETKRLRTWNPKRRWFEIVGEWVFKSVESEKKRIERNGWEWREKKKRKVYIGRLRLQGHVTNGRGFRVWAYSIRVGSLIYCTRGVDATGWTRSKSCTLFLLFAIANKQTIHVYL